MSTTKNVDKEVYNRTELDGFGWWVVLAISVLSAPVFAIVTAYNMPFKGQIGEILMMALTCCITLYISVYLKRVYDVELVVTQRNSVPDDEDIPTPSALDEVNLNFAEQLIAYENYISKINKLNAGFMAAKDNIPATIHYHRSCDYSQ